MWGCRRYNHKNNNAHLLGHEQETTLALPSKPPLREDYHTPYLKGCPCGYYGDTVKACTCSPSKIAKYLQRISGPLLDRIDIYMEVPRLHQEEMLHAGGTGESSAAVRECLSYVAEAIQYRALDRKL